MKVIKNDINGYLPDMAEVDTKLKIGDKLKLEYDWCKLENGICSKNKYMYKDICEFTVADIVCNALSEHHSVWVRLSTDDELFIKRCGSKEFDAPEKKVLERLVP